MQIHGRWVTPVLSPEDRRFVMVRPLRVTRGNVPFEALSALSLEDFDLSGSDDEGGADGL